MKCRLRPHTRRIESESAFLTASPGDVYTPYSLRNNALELLFNKYLLAGRLTFNSSLEWKGVFMPTLWMQKLRLVRDYAACE